MFALQGHVLIMALRYLSCRSPRDNVATGPLEHMRPYAQPRKVGRNRNNDAILLAWPPLQILAVKMDFWLCNLGGERHSDPQDLTNLHKL